MKVYLGDRAHASSGGMYRVMEGLYNYLPCEIVESPDDADVIHAQIALYETVPADKPLVVSSHGLYWREDNWGKKQDKVNNLCISAYTQADVVTAPSHFVARAIARNCLVTPQVVLHGIDTDEWQPGDNAGFVLWNKARVDAANDPAPVNILARRCKYPFISTFGVAASNVKIIGRVMPETMKNYTRHAGVYLATARESGGPCFGVLEAMASGVPVLSWNYGGTAEAVVHKATGYLAEEGNYDDLLAGLHYCMQHRQRLGENARQAVIDHWQWQHVIDGYVTAYERALAPDYIRNRVSVIITSHNLAEFLPGAIESALQQTWPDTEVIVVDDASFDGSADIARQYPVTVIANKTNQHVSEARNIGIRAATGNYILPLDADDRLYPDAVENLFRHAERSAPVVAGHLHVYHESDLQGKYVESGWPNDTDVTKQIKGYNRIPYASLYHRRVWENIGGYRRRIRTGVEDADFWTRAMSYGFEAKLIDKPVLRYTKRDGMSLGKINQRGHEAWTSWFGWHYDKQIAPIGSGLTGDTWSFDSPEVSVIIPVGPGHAPHIQTCIDSLLAQTFDNWEAIVINDTGEKWFDPEGKHLTNFTQGMSFVIFIDNAENHGVAAARNQGIDRARGKRLVFLDVDDTAQPALLELLVKAQDKVDGWVYPDWYSVTEDDVQPGEAADWDYNTLLNRSLGPITGIYRTEHVRLVNGFDEQAPGWEDWDFHLRLVREGICGTRLKAKLLTYNMHLGQRREDNFRDRNNLLQYIYEKHKDMRGVSMACRTCGGRQSVVVRNNNQNKTQNNMANEMNTLMVFEGEGVSIKTYVPPTNPLRPKYKIQPNKPFYVFESDVAWFLSHAGFRVVQKPEDTTVTQVEHEPLVSDIPARRVHLVTELPMSDATIGVLIKEFSTIESLAVATDADILGVSGVGEKRLQEIRSALDTWQQKQSV